MSYTSIGTSSQHYSKQDVTSARRFFRSVERVVIQYLDLGVNLCKVVRPYYAAGDIPPDGNRLSDFIGSHAPFVIAADNLVGTIPGLYIQGYSFPAQYLVERSRSFISDLRDCSDTTFTELFVDIDENLNDLTHCIKWARKNRFEIQPIDFRRQLNDYFEKVLKTLAAIHKRFRVMESDMERPHRGGIYVQGYVAVPVHQLNQIQKTEQMTLRVANEALWYASEEERGTLRNEKQLGGDVRLEMEQVAVERIKDSPQNSLPQRKAAREVAAEYDGRPGAYPNNPTGHEALRKRIQRECNLLGLTG